MRYIRAMDTFIPKLRPVKRAGAPGARVGGIPFGFPVEKWPRCDRCKAPMTLFLQLPHLAVYAPLDGKTLFVFQCSDLDRQGCSEYDEIGNACFLLGEDDLTSENTPQPACEGESPDGWSLEDWSREDDEREDVDGERHPRLCTKFGGEPGWIQGGVTLDEGWRFLCQIDTDGNFDGWIGIQNSGIAYVFVRGGEAQLIWQCG
jgi:hypothetical protein